MKTYPIPVPLMQDIINILQTLPWGQVNNTMQTLLPIIQKADQETAMIGMPKSNGNIGAEKNV